MDIFMLRQECIIQVGIIGFPKKPEDISSFIFLGEDIERKPPWKLVSYATFINDRKGKLFLATG